MSRNIWEIEEPSYILGTCAGGGHGKRAECKRCGSSTQSAAGHPGMAQVLKVVDLLENSSYNLEGEIDGPSHTAGSPTLEYLSG